MPNLSTDKSSKKTDDLKMRMKQIGLTALPQPSETPQTMPVTMTDLDSKSLGNAMSKYCAWREYYDSLYTEALIDYTRVKREYDRKEAMLKYAELTSTSNGKETKEVKLLRVEIDSDIFALKENLEEHELYKEALYIKLENLTNNINVLSREITRRQSVNERG